MPCLQRHIVIRVLGTRMPEEFLQLFHVMLVQIICRDAGQAFGHVPNQNSSESDQRGRKEGRNYLGGSF